MIFDQSGSRITVTRHDYLPFGEELFAGVGGRTTSQGYPQSQNDTQSSGARQQFTQMERDRETNLDYFGARYFSSTQGRFTSADNFVNDTTVADPSSWNLYAYVRNNPLRFIDPTGERVYVGAVQGDDRDILLRRINATYGCDSCVGVDADGYLTVDTSGLSGDVIEATQFLTNAIQSTNPLDLFDVTVTNNDPRVAFGQSQRGNVNLRQANGTMRTMSSVNIRLDFGDDDAVMGDPAAKASFLDFVFAHEVSHFYPSWKQDPFDGRRGPVDNPINEIRRATGRLLRSSYVARGLGGHSTNTGGGPILSLLSFGIHDYPGDGKLQYPFEPLRGSDGLEVSQSYRKTIFWVTKVVKSR
jgi:RHS repeat-associated protein